MFKTSLLMNLLSVSSYYRYCCVYIVVMQIKTHIAYKLLLKLHLRIPLAFDFDLI
jgi:hypothetical protein